MILACFILSFSVTFILTPKWIRVAKRIGLVGKDMNKYNKPEVAEMGGITVLAGFLSGIFLYIAINTFVFNLKSNLIYILALVSSVLIIGIIGILDDILGWKVGLKKWQKPLLTFFASIPLMVVNAGKSEMIFPLIGKVDLGIFYPLIIIPIGITGASNAFNMIAGYNGLEAGMGIIILSALSYVAYVNGYPWVSVIGLCMVFSLLAFLIYNWYPAKIFPGDTLTYSVGALIACIAILANMEKIAVLLFVLYYIDFLLHIRAGLNLEAFGKPTHKGYLDLPYGNNLKDIYKITHLSIYILKRIKKRVYEVDVVLFILTLQIIITLIVLAWYGYLYI